MTPPPFRDDDATGSSPQLDFARVHERIFVERESSGVRVADLLEQHFAGSDRRFWRQALRTGRVTLDGECVAPQRRLRPGAVVELRFDPAEVRERDVEPVGSEPAADAVPVLYEDAALLIAEKPAGVHTVPDRGGKYRGVHGLLAELRPDDELRIVHRLDLGTSGCLVLAKGLEASRALSAAFEAREVHKEYLALVAGVVRRAPLEVRKALGPDRRRPGRIRVVEASAKGAREAHTDVELVEQFRRHALVRARPRTGRSHQIRVHLAALGHGILGDRDYGPKAPLLLSDLKPSFKLRRGVQERPLLHRMFLHAAAIEVVSPASGQRVRAEAPLPSELELPLTKLRKFAGAAHPTRGGMRCD